MESDGVVYLSSPQALGPYPDADHRPARALGQGGSRPRLPGAARSDRWMAHADLRRTPSNGVGRISQALLDRRLSRERPILILSGNGIDHALLALAAMHVGVPYAPIAPAYSLQAQGLRHASADLRAAQARPRVRGRRGRVRTRAVAGPARRASSSWSRHHRRQRSRRHRSSDLLATAETGAVDDARRLVGPGHHRQDSVHVRDPPVIRRASSTRSGCCARTRK